MTVSLAAVDAGVATPESAIAEAGVDRCPEVWVVCVVVPISVSPPVSSAVQPAANHSDADNANRIASWIIGSNRDRHSETLPLGAVLLVILGRLDLSRFGVVPIHRYVDTF